MNELEESVYFEQWVKSWKPVCDLRGEKAPDGWHYFDDSMDLLWKAWRARAILAARANS